MYRFKVSDLKFVVKSCELEISSSNFFVADFMSQEFARILLILDFGVTDSGLGFLFLFFSFSFAAFFGVT